MVEQMVGITLAGCKIIKLIGKGGMGSVYLGRQVDLGRFVAVKVLSKNLIQEEGFLRRFKREARAVASLSHPNIVQVHQYGEEDGIHFIVMEYVEGETLGAKLSEGETLGEQEVIRIAKQSAIGIREAQEKNIVHRDIKPDNIILNKEGEVKVTDFGLAKNLSSTQEQSLVTKQIIGTPAYISPEQIKGTEIDPRSDLYSLGATMYHALSGKPPFTAKNPFELLEKHLKEKPVPPIEVKPGVSQAMSDVVLKCLAKDADRRYQSATELIEDLERLEVGGKPLPGRRLPVSSLRWPVRLVLAAVVIAAIAWVGSRWTSGGDGENPRDVANGNGTIDPNPPPVDPRAEAMKTFRRLVGEAAELEDEGHLEVAIKKLREALQIQPDDAEVLARVEGLEEQYATQQRMAAEKRELDLLRHEALDGFWELRDQAKKDMTLLDETIRRLEELDSRVPGDAKVERYLKVCQRWKKDLEMELVVKPPGNGGNGENPPIEPKGNGDNGDNGEGPELPTKYPYKGTVFTKSGDPIDGEILAVTKTHVEIKTHWGKVAVERRNVTKIEAEERDVRPTGNDTEIKLPDPEESFKFAVDWTSLGNQRYLLKYDFTEAGQTQDWKFMGATLQPAEGVVLVRPGGRIEFGTRFEGAVEIEMDLEPLGTGTLQVFIYTHNVGISTKPAVVPGLFENWGYREVKAPEEAENIHLQEEYTIVNVKRENRRAWLSVDYGDEVRLKGEIPSGLGSIGIGARGAGFRIFGVRLRGTPKP